MSTSASPNTQQQSHKHLPLSEFQTAVLQASGITLYRFKHKTGESTDATDSSPAELVTNTQGPAPTGFSEHQAVQQISQSDVQKYSAILSDIQVAINLISAAKERAPLKVMQWWVGDAFSVDRDSVTLPRHPQHMNGNDKRELWRIICENTRN